MRASWSSTPHISWCRRAITVSALAACRMVLVLSAQQVARTPSILAPSNSTTTQDSGLGDDDLGGQGSFGLGGQSSFGLGGQSSFGLGGQGSSANATGSSGISPSVTQNPGLGDQKANSSQDSTAFSGANPPVALSASSIIAILQQNPDAVVELKSLMADLSQQQGTPIQAGSITDEMLYSKIESSPELRANITTFLRARGYISDDDLSAAYTDGADSDLTGNMLRPDRGLGSTTPQPRVSLDPFANPPEEMKSDRGQFRLNEDRTNQPGQTTGQPKLLRRPAPYNMLALRDLYTQLPEQNGRLKRFGSDVFLSHSPYSQRLASQDAQRLPLSIPAGPDYVVGPGDVLAISLWGGFSQSISRPIDRDGKVELPEAGPVQVAGLTLEHVDGVITQALQHQYRDIHVAVTLSRLRSIRVYVVGDVQRPGAYDVSSLATSLDALTAAGGPTNVGSLRIVRHYRGSKLVGEIDLYDFLVHGVQNEDRIQSGDTLIVPPAGPQIAVYGAVKRPAIYELKDQTSLAAVLNDAGGVTVSAELGHIIIDRINANHERETTTLNISSNGDEAARAATAAYVIHDGDRVHVSAILPYSDKVVYTEGHLVRPGRMPYHDGMQLSDVLHSYRDLLPEPADRGEIVRLVPPDLHPETIDFNVPDVMIGNNNMALQPFDTIRVYGRYEADAPKVTIGGEVLRPGKYPLTRGMTAAQLVRMAGGFKRGALLTDADLTSYNIVGGTKVESDRVSIRIGDAVSGNDASTDPLLKPGDVLTIHQLTGWSDIGSSITLVGEVAHPGVYGFQQGERLSSILRRAGGFRSTSYPAGAVLIREDVRRLEEKNREELIRQIETSSASARISPNLGSTDQGAVLQLIAQQQSDVLARLRSHPASGRMVIHIAADISSWENTPADIEVRAGDVLRIPKRPGFVLISGQVYNESAITYAPGKTSGWYLRRAGGATQIANKKQIFIIRANGSVVGREGGLWGDNVLSTQLNPGDSVVVPQKIIGASLFWKNLLTVAQIASSVSITAAVAGGL
jgi:protein involved in polysaccharide export with SLBB domain